MTSKFTADTPAILQAKMSETDRLCLIVQSDTDSLKGESQVQAKFYIQSWICQHFCFDCLLYSQYFQSDVGVKEDIDADKLRIIDEKWKLIFNEEKRPPIYSVR